MELIIWGFHSKLDLNANAYQEGKNVTDVMKKTKWFYGLPKSDG